MNEIQAAIEHLKTKHGSLRAAARAINEDHAYLWRLSNGRKANPSERVLKKLGLTREMRYKKVNGKT
jgi:hypothetical protein